MMLQTAFDVLREIDAETAANLQQALDKPAWHPECFRAGNLGLYNAGKSTTLNALVDDVENATFASDDIPKTKRLQHHLQAGVELMDTPGLDVDSDDDAKAFEGLMHCDVILLVHSLSAGEMDAVSLNALKSLNNQDPEPLAKRLIAVWTCASEVSLREDTVLADRLTEQLYDAAGGHPVQVSVDNLTYLKALRQNKARLMAHSGIPTLKRHIADMQESQHQVYQAREARRRHRLHQGLAVVQREMQDLSQQQQTERQAILRKIRAPLAALTEHQAYLANMAAGTG